MVHKIKYWTIADTHLGHTAMMQYENRPKNFSKKILSLIKHTVTENSIFIHLGDICIGNEAVWHTQLMNALPSTTKKWLVRGNHDKRTDSWYLTHGWDSITNAIVLHKFEYLIMLTHCPINKDMGEFYTIQADILKKKFINIHGHIHSSNKYNYNAQNYHYLLTCGVPCNLFTLNYITKKQNKAQYEN